MAKLAFSKLNLKIPTEVVNIPWGDQNIEVKQFIPLDEKTRIISKVVNECWDEEAKFWNSCKYEVLTRFEIVKAYTNIVFTEKQEKEFSKTYDLLTSNNLIDRIIPSIPTNEYLFIINGVIEAIKALYEYNHSVLGILDTVKEDYSNLDLDATEIQQKLADPQNMELLKTVLTKLG